MKPIVIESPYGGDVRLNQVYLRRVIKWCVDHGYTPYASHEMLTHALDDLVPAQRALGLAAGRAMTDVLVAGGARHVFWIDRGISQGMLAALDHVSQEPRRRVDFTSLKDNPLVHCWSVRASALLNPGLAWPIGSGSVSIMRRVRHLMAVAQDARQ